MMEGKSISAHAVSSGMVLWIAGLGLRHVTEADHSRKGYSVLMMKEELLPWRYADSEVFTHVADWDMTGWYTTK